MAGAGALATTGAGAGVAAGTGGQQVLALGPLQRPLARWQQRVQQPPQPRRAPPPPNLV